MASKPNHTKRRAVRLGRSALTGQVVLQPVGSPSRSGLKSVISDTEFTSADTRILHLAARKASNALIARQLGLSEAQVRNTLERAKIQYRTNSRVDAARAFVHARERQARNGSYSV